MTKKETKLPFGIPGNPMGAINAGMLNSTMQQFGGMEGMTELFASLIVQNQDKFIEGLESLEAKYATKLQEGGFDGLTMSFAIAEVKGKKILVGLLLPYKNLKNDEGIITGTAIETYNLGTFAEKLMQGAKNLSKKNGNK